MERPLTLTLDDLRARERVARPITFECAGNGRALLEPRPVSQPWLTEAVGTAEWGGTPLAPLLDEAGVKQSAVEAAVQRARPRHRGRRRRRATSARCRSPRPRDALLAYEMNGAPLPPQHGFPLRLVVPGWYGMTNVKWLTRITVLEEPFTGFQNSVGYRMYDADGEPGEPVTRMLPRSLMVPPGVPDFMTRERHLEPGPVDAHAAAHGPATGRSSAWRCPPTAARRFARRRRSTRRSARTPGAAGASTGTRRPASTCSQLARHRRRRQHAAARRRPGT